MQRSFRDRNRRLIFKGIIDDLDLQSFPVVKKTPVVFRRIGILGKHKIIFTEYIDLIGIIPDLINISDITQIDSEHV